MLKNLAASLLLALALWSCQTPPVYHSYKDMPDEVWVYDSAAVFDFQVADPAVPYDLYYNIRHTRNYPFYNLYVQYQLQNASGGIMRQSMHEVNLLHPQEGKPLGSGESLYDHRVKIIERYKFEQAGRYQFRISQYMRTDSLQGIQAVGFTLLPSEQKQ